MRHFCSILYFFLVSNNLLAATDSIPVFDKPMIDSECIQQWYYIENRQAITADGKYFLFVINNKPKGSSTLYLGSTDSSWSIEFNGVSNGFFSGDNKLAIFQKDDQLYLLELGTDNKEIISNVSNYQTPSNGNDQWIAYLLNSPTNDLVVSDLLNNIKYKFKYVTDYIFDEKGRNLIITADSPTIDNTLQVIRWMSLDSISVNTIWSNNRTSSKYNSFKNFIFDDLGNQLIFTNQMVSKNEVKIFESAKSVWYCDENTKITKLLVDSILSGNDSNFVIQSLIGFNKSKKRIIFRLSNIERNNFEPYGQANVRIWSYKDAFLQPDLKSKSNHLQKTSFLATVPINGGKILILEKENEYKASPQIPDEYIVVGNETIEPWWKLDPSPKFYLENLANGSRIFLKQDTIGITTENFYFSADNKWLIYFDTILGAYFSYNILTGNVKNISKSIPVKFKSEYGNSLFHEAVSSVAGWVEEDNCILLYDNYDIWEVDPAGKKSAINITNGYGSKHNIKLRLIEPYNSLSEGQVFKKNSKAILSAFSTKTKFNGFFSIRIGQNINPELLTLGPFSYYLVQSQKPNLFSFDDGIIPIKAKNTDTWLITRQTSFDAPNYYCTKNFKTFVRLTNLQPQHLYNWLKAELVHWKQFDGTKGLGILYKPENFNPNWRYPVILNYYEQFSQELFQLPQPGYTESTLNIPWFVSHGYLVFLPDIQFKNTLNSGKTAYEWSYNSIVSAAIHLSTLPYVNRKKIGLQGHSFAGGQTNYIISHTRYFAAAAEAAGDTDPVSSYLSLVPFDAPFDHYSKQGIFEIGQAGYNFTLWQRPDLYLKNSAVLNANKIVTPLLIMHNELDNNIPWRQGVELYLALRRLGKKVWMLQYEQGGHSLIEKDAEDYTKRLQQFFDYYLKDKLPPVWMISRILPNLKKNDPSVELDTSGQIP